MKYICPYCDGEIEQHKTDAKIIAFQKLCGASKTISFECKPCGVWWWCDSKLNVFRIDARHEKRRWNVYNLPEGCLLIRHEVAV